MKKIALITGITGQDGSLLARFLLKKKYIVHGIVRRSSSFNTQRIEDIYEYKMKKNKNLHLHYGDLVDSSNLFNIINKVMPDEIYNLGAQSHVKVSFETPEYTANVDGLGTLRILEIIKSLNRKKKIKFYQASTSELFGNALPPQNEKTNFEPASPYAAAKLYAHWITKIYREAYNVFACSGILFNHEGPYRGDTFVTKKIVKSALKLSNDDGGPLIIGNLYAKRDWGDAEEYVQGMWKIMQHKKPDDFVLATNKSYTVKDFINKTFSKLDISIKWKGKGVDEVGIDSKTGKVLIKVSSEYYRPLEVNYLKGDFNKAKRILKWSPKVTLDKLIEKMINFEKNK
tara:strand:- start:404 stop:1432 length:1029 start_codon:yes stop_codon:yes gene_type:complete